MTANDIRPGLIRNLATEQESLADIVSGIAEERWNDATPAPGWTIRHQVAHLAFFERAATMSVRDPGRFAAERRAADIDPEAYGESVLDPYLAMPAEALLEAWQLAGREFGNAALAAEPGSRHPWYGLSMSTASMITARIMETWAHGQDVVDALGADRRESEGLPQVARLACLARSNPYLVRGLEPPTSPLLVKLTTAEGDTWRWGDENADQTITGRMTDFCLVMTRRRHVEDTDLVAEGVDALEWLRIGQAYAGEPGPGRRPLRTFQGT